MEPPPSRYLDLVRIVSALEVHLEELERLGLIPAAVDDEHLAYALTRYRDSKRLLAGHWQQLEDSPASPRGGPDLPASGAQNRARADAAVIDLVPPGEART